MCRGVEYKLKVGSVSSYIKGVLVLSMYKLEWLHLIAFVIYIVDWNDKMYAIAVRCVYWIVVWVNCVYLKSKKSNWMINLKQEI